MSVMYYVCGTKNLSKSTQVWRKDVKNKWLTTQELKNEIN